MNVLSPKKSPFSLPDFEEFRINKFIHRDLFLRLNNELRRKNINVPLRFYVSTEWFCEDQTTNIAIPFYLCHPELPYQLSAMGVPLEGMRVEDCLKILRHEVGHAVDHYYQLRRFKKRQKLFGLSSTPYPEYYAAKRNPDYVEHLSDFYSQSHPDEDWAETFAKWLSVPRGNFDKSSQALREKFELVDRLLSTQSLSVLKPNTRPFLDELNSNEEVRLKIKELFKDLKYQKTSGPRSKMRRLGLLTSEMNKKMEEGYRIYSM